MRITTLSNCYLIDWWRNVDFRLLACWFDFRFCCSCFTWETGGLELASTIIPVLQASRLIKCASQVWLSVLVKCAIRLTKFGFDVQVWLLTGLTSRSINPSRAPTCLQLPLALKLNITNLVLNTESLRL